MCYTVASNKKKAILEPRFQAEFEGEEVIEYSVSGFTHPKLPVISSDAPGKISLVQWGLIPAWASSKEKAYMLNKQTLNAKGETIFEKPSFRKSASKRKCCVLVNGFFEWQTNGKEKTPYFIYMKNQEAFAMGGLWDEWIDTDNGELLRTFSIITTEANLLMAKIHNTKQRMPFILQPGQEKEWLSVTGESDTMKWIKPLNEELLAAHPVSKLVNGKSGNANVPEVQEPVEERRIPVQGSLF